MMVDLTSQGSCIAHQCKTRQYYLIAAVSRAYACLSDPDKRANYDRYG